MVNNKAFKYVFEKIYNKGNFINLIVSVAKIKKINKFYKNNYDKYLDFELFVSAMGELKNSLLKSSAALLEFKKQFNISKGLQPSIITECFIAQTVAESLDLNNFLDIDDGGKNVPIEFAMHLLSFQGITGKAFPRYIYYNNNNSIFLLQYGDASSVDAIFVKDKVSVRIEFKEEKSKLTEPDIGGLYGEDGKLIISEAFNEKYSEYNEFINIFNSQTSVFNHIGRNFKIADYLNSGNIKSISEKVFKIKIIDLFILQCKDTIYPVPSEVLLQNIVLTGSEIRTAGRNFIELFTPIYAEKVISEMGGIIENGVISLKYDKSKESVGRNISKVTRYKINNLLFVKSNKIIFNHEQVSFNIKDVMQLKPTISLHINSNINTTILKQISEKIK